MIHELEKMFGVILYRGSGMTSNIVTRGDVDRAIHM
jgi:hypothetical protein